MITAFANLKGGVGKSILNAYFANYMANNGHRTLLVDCDVNQRSTKVYEYTETDNLDIIYYEFSDGDIIDYLLALNEAYDLIVVDLPGSFQQSGVLTAFSVMDCVFLPTSIASEDLNSTKMAMDLLEEVPVKKQRVVMNKIEVQFSSEIRNEEENGFPSYNEYFDGKVLEKGFRLERSLFNNNFSFGEQVYHKNRKRVEETMEMVKNELINQ